MLNDVLIHKRGLTYISDKFTKRENLAIMEEGNDYFKRLLTFKQWHNPIVNKISLAKVGFSFTGISDKVQCQYCHGKLLSWEIGDDPFTEHKKYFPGCPFILQLEEDNKKHVAPKYQDLKTRIESFPLDTIRRTPSELAVAGFYCTGSADRVRCFHCGLTVRDWDLKGDPFEIHRIYNPACAFIQNITDFQRLGIQECGKQGEEGKNLIQGCIDEGLINNPRKQELIDNISPESPLFQKLLRLYEKDIIVREMIVMIQRHGRNFKTPEEFATLVAHRKLSQRDKSCKDSDDLKAENDRFLAEKQCQLCRNNTTSVLFLPCGHLITCSQCADTVSDCFNCHKKVHGKVIVYKQ